MKQKLSDLAGTWKITDKEVKEFTKRLEKMNYKIPSINKSKKK